MKRFIVSRLPAPGRPSPLSREEGRHALQVYRLQDGDAVEALDGSGGSCRAVIRVGREVTLEHSGASRALDPSAQILPVTVELAVLKGDAMAEAIQKCVELGASTLQPVLTEYMVVKLGGKGEGAFVARWRKIADQSLKQCGRLTRLDILDPLALASLPKARTGELSFYCDEDSVTAERTESLVSASRSAGSASIRLAIGPEGGWSPADREHLARSGRRPVSLGPLVLRADTAVAFALSVCAAMTRPG
jgi:16S rRNA (uracil1498-N3)-methyltransferase